MIPGRDAAEGDRRGRTPAPPPPPSVVDRLLGAVARGDRAAFDRLYAVTAPRAYAVSRRVLGPGPEADEAFQDAYLKTWRHADQWPGADGTGLSWLLAIVRHAAIDRRRGAERRARHADGLAGRVPAPTPAPDPEDAAALASEAEHLAACLDGLPQGRAAVVRRAYFSGDSYAELAEETGRPEGTLKSWVHRSLGALRACLEGRGVERNP